MKIKYIFYIIALFSLISLTNCEDVLDKTNYAAVTPDKLLNDPLYAKAYLNIIYFYLMPSWPMASTVAATGFETDEIVAERSPMSTEVPERLVLK